MKRRILAILLCACMAMTGFVRSFAEGDQTGDVNGDGKVTPADAAFVLRYCAGFEWRNMTTRHKMRADVDHNGRVDEQDAAAILRHVVRASAFQSVQTDATLFRNLSKKSKLDEDHTEWVAQFIQALPSGGARKVLYAASKYIGKPYSQYDCSTFVRTAFRDAGYKEAVYPSGGSNNVRKEFLKRGKLKQVVYLDESEQAEYADTSDWTPGTVLIYLLYDDVNKEIILDSEGNEQANHVALYVGTIDGKAIIMDSGTSDGVRLRELWSYGKWKLSYYVDPLD